MIGIALLLLALLTVVDARKNFRTGAVPIGFDDFTISEESGEQSVQTVTMLTPTFVESSEREKATKEKEEEEELARVLAWEQKKIKELQERRERMKRERKAEIERILREQAEEQARIETARAERRRRKMLEEQKRILEEAKKERERQEKLLAELEYQKQQELERLKEENKWRQLKEEEERRKSEEEEIRRRKEEEEERRRKVEEEEYRRRKEEEEAEEQIRQKEDLRRRQKEEEKRREEEDEKKQKDLERQIREKEEEQRRLLVEEKRRMEEKESRQQDEHRNMLEQQRKASKEDIQRLEQEKDKNHLQGKPRRRWIEMNRLGQEVERKGVREQLETNHMQKKESLDEKKISSRFADSLSRRRQELLARFGSQARSRSSTEVIERSGEGSNDAHGSTWNSSSSSIAYTDGNSEHNRSPQQDTWNANERHSEVPEPENTINDNSAVAIVEPSKPLVRKTIQRRLRAIKSYTESKPSDTSVEKLEGDDASYLGGWKEHTEKGFLPTNYSSPTGIDLTLFQPIPGSTTVQQQITGPNTRWSDPADQVAGLVFDEEYLRAYYEQYYNEWYRQHNQAAMLTPEPTEAPTSSRKITIKMGSQWGIPEITPQTPLLPAQPSAQSLVPVQPTETQAFAMPAPAYGKTLSREQLNKICVDTQTTSRKFGISDPKSFALNNCPLVQMYYKHVTCEQINHVMEYCEQNLLLV